MTTVSRRNFLKAGTAGVLGAAGLAALATRPAQGDSPPVDVHPSHREGHAGNVMVGDVDPNGVNQFDPTAILTDWDYGKVSTLPSG